MKIALVLLSMISLPALAQRSRVMEEHMSRVAEERARAAGITRAADANGNLVRANQTVSCDGSGPQVSLVKMNFKDGTQGSYLVHGTRGPLHFDRRLHVLRFENGVLKSTPHHMVWGLTYGGWRFERQPELAQSCPRCDRFGDVENWTIESVSLRDFAGCPAPAVDNPVAISSDEGTSTR